MKNIKYLLYVALAVLALILCKCIAPEKALRQFSRQVASADCIVLTNSYDAWGVTVTGTNVANIIAAIKWARVQKIWGNISEKDWREEPKIRKLEFYAGTNHLASLPVLYSVFRLNGVNYMTSNGALTALDPVYRAHEYPMH